jgi:mRNA-degrading endonuclease RelE of RelBE toxin-antitoxin system
MRGSRTTEGGSSEGGEAGRQTRAARPAGVRAEGPNPFHPSPPRSQKSSDSQQFIKAFFLCEEDQLGADLGATHGRKNISCPRFAWVPIGTAGCRKLRWRVSGRKGGKSGGMRVIYYFRNTADQIIFLLAYDHRSVDDLTPRQKRQLADIVRQLK